MDHQILIIGGGPGGYVAAIRASQLGFNVALAEKRTSLGGTCLNVGCIPSKALLDSSEHYHNATHKFENHGIQFKELKLDFAKMMQRKNEVVSATTKGIDFLMKKNKIKVYNGIASFIDKNTVKIADQKITSEKIIIASGSEPIPLPFAPFDEKFILSSTGALALTSLPKSLVVIGGGVIAVEMSSIFARLGCKVTVIEFTDKIIGSMDKDLSKELLKSLKKLNIEFHLSTEVTKIEVVKNETHISATSLKDNKEINLKAEKTLIAIGRRAYTEGLFSSGMEIKKSKNGKIVVNENFQTNIDNIYAIGDVIDGAMLAHKASEEGNVCVEKIAGQKSHLDYKSICGVVYTWPEVASVGHSEEELKEKKIEYKKGLFPFKASGRARAADEDEGFIKILSDKQNDEILGIHMIGPRVADLIAESMVAMEYKASAEDLAMLPYPHPTFSEAIKEAALMATGNRAIHI